MRKKKSAIRPSKFHRLEPDYQRAPYQLPKMVKKKMLKFLRELYGHNAAKSGIGELERVIQVYYAHKSQEMLDWEKSFNPTERFSEEDVILITYGDLISDDTQPPLHILAELCKKYLKGVFNTLHILPFFPSSSDRGFSVTDFTEVDPHLGRWEDLTVLKDDFRLMFDGVFNHISAKSKWFQEFLNQNPRFVNFFTVFSTSEKIPSDYLKLLVRPRTSDVLTPFDTLVGKKFVWTTFSPDQIDLNFSNPEVLIKMIDILLFYVRKGADHIRLDAVTYLWDELGTSGAHLKQTHIIIKLFRLVLDAVAPHVALITETNVPHEDNIKYFGNGHDEAQMVYNFALPPLVLHSFQNSDSTKLTEWASGLYKISDTATYFNFLDSHDGIGVMAVKNILTVEEIEMMSLRILEHGGFISYKAEGDGTESPYELNITWYSAINRDDSNDTRELKIKRYLASRAIALVVMFTILMFLLKSYMQTLMIMSLIPLGVIGAVMGHYIIGIPVSILSFLGLVALAGIIINDSVVLVDKYNNLLKSGMNVPDALLEAGMARFRPIVLTTITTAAGLAPIIFLRSEQGQFLIPMAVSVAFGLIFGTILTLLALPSALYAINDLRVMLNKMRNKKGNRLELEPAYQRGITEDF